jgi:glycosyltransferase involved in cell wall biosynthesis
MTLQKTENLFDFSIVVVDNDSELSGKAVAESHIVQSVIQIAYYQEERRSISHARNTAVRHATGNYIAFIDDDEFPDDNWLVKLYSTQKEFNSDGVLGPVKPHFEIDPPGWILKSGVCERESFFTGYFITNYKYTRTGNALLKKKILCEEEEPFDPKFGLIGGGDADYFRRMLEKGYTFVWCNEAYVYETVPPFRFKRSYYIKRALTRGATTVYSKFISINTMKSVIALCVYIPALPLLCITGHHLFMRYFIKTCDHLGKLLAFSGIKIIQQRPY